MANSPLSMEARSRIIKIFINGFILVLALLSTNYGQVIENISKNDSKSIRVYQSEKPKEFRIGLISIAGFGLNKIPLGETDAGDKITISAGGGIGLGFDMGYAFNPFFELSVAMIQIQVFPDFFPVGLYNSPS